MSNRHKSALKRMRQDQKRRARNTSIKSALKTYAKKVEMLVEQKDAENAETLLRKAVSAFDKAAGKGVIHPKKAARKKSVLSRKVHLLHADK